MRAKVGVAACALALVAAALATVPVAAMAQGSPALAQGSSPASAASATAIAPSEIDGQIDGRKARFIAQGDDVLVSATEAERIGLAYLDGKQVSIGGTPLWIVTLNSVTVAGRTRLLAPAGVVPSIAGYFAALRAHPAEAFARSREIQVEIGGVKVTAYDLGEAGVLLSIDAAERAGLRYQQGRRQEVGAITAWVVADVPVRLGAQQAPSTVTVTQPEAYFESLLAAAAKAR